MLKCPNCGSTAQVQITKRYWSTIANSENIHCVCGCGCVFHLEKMSNGIVNGRWQMDTKIKK